MFANVNGDMFALAVANMSDLAIVLTAADGVVRDVAFGDPGLSGQIPRLRPGTKLADHLTVESRPKLEALLSGNSEKGRWRHLNFPGEQLGVDVPISMQAFGLGSGRVLIVGRDERQAAALQRRFMAAQHDLESTFTRLRQADMRYQTLLHMSELAVLTLDGDDFTIIDINALASDYVRQGNRKLLGRKVASILAPDDVERVEQMLRGYTASSRGGNFIAHLRNGEARRFQAAAFRFAGSPRLVLRIEQTDGEAPSPGELFQSLFARFPTAMVVTHSNFEIISANRAFVDLIQLSLEENAVGQQLERFVGERGVDTSVLRVGLLEQGTVREFASTVTTAFGEQAEIDLDAAAARFGPEEYFLFMLHPRENARRAAGAAFTADRDEGEMAERIVAGVGRLSMKEIVRDVTDRVERLCIENALRLTGNNRASAAEMLGVSRQNLYDKLRRFGIDGGRDEEESVAGD